MFANHLGENLGVRNSYLIPSKTVLGNPTVKLDRDCDHTVGADDPALVIRTQSEDGTWQWKPVKNVELVTSFLNTATAQERRENLGLWQDKKSWMLGQPDGFVQDNEVTTMGSEWDKPELCGTEEHFSPKDNLVSAYRESFTKVDGDRVKCEVRTGVTGTIAVLEEPVYVGESRTHVADRLRLHPYRQYWYVDSWNSPTVETFQPKPPEPTPEYLTFQRDGGNGPTAAQPPFSLREFNTSYRELVAAELRKD